MIIYGVEILLMVRVPFTSNNISTPYIIKCYVLRQENNSADSDIKLELSFDLNIVPSDFGITVPDEKFKSTIQISLWDAPLNKTEEESLNNTNI